MAVRRVCLVGAGYISHVHAEALKAVPGVELSVVVDPNIQAAGALAAKWGIGKVYATIEEALAAGSFDCAHVVVPPPLHAPLGCTLLKAGIPVFLEKPLAVDAAGCDALLAAAAAGNAVLGVNQNFVHHPAFRQLLDKVERRDLGALEAVDCLYSVPLRQMAARQFSHWMFQEPRNILLEQAVHPLSQIAALVGHLGEVQALAGAPTEISPGVPFYSTCSVSLAGTRAPAALQFGVGRPYPFWQVSALCEDGVIVADMIGNRIVTYERSRWLEVADNLLTGRRVGGQTLRQSRANALDYILSMLKLKPRSDAFYQSMLGSISAFHAALDRNVRPILDGTFGAALVTTCERIAGLVFTTPIAKPQPHKAEAYDVAVLGGTGFIGRSVVAQCRAAGFTVGVMARNLRNLAANFYEDGVTLMAGDVTREADVRKAIGNAKLVINLAHGGGGGDWPAVERSMVGSARTVAEVCLEKGVERLVHVGSIAGLYLGDPSDTVTGATPPDPMPEQRSDYARGKAVADGMLLDLHRQKGLPVCILRPALVVGEGSSPFHSGLGFYNNDQYCLGWNMGTNPLPFVLVDDVAQATVTALRAEGVVGKTYNLVGDVCPSARDYIAMLAASLRRPLRFHPQPVWKLQMIELGKWLVKRLVGRKVPPPSIRDLKSRGLVARFDCSDAKRDLQWQPVGDPAVFRQQAVDVHRRPAVPGRD